jgi:histidyl-tRNA synthetase
LVLQFPDSAQASATVARIIREAGIATELYPDAERIASQLRYAERKGHRAAVFYGPDEQEQGVVKIRDLRPRAEVTVDLEALPMRLPKLLS